MAAHGGAFTGRDAVGCGWVRWGATVCNGMRLDMAVLDESQVSLRKQCPKVTSY